MRTEKKETENIFDMKIRLVFNSAWTERIATYEKEIKVLLLLKLIALVSVGHDCAVHDTEEMGKREHMYL
jgi:hypothetical protein